ncbi:hypothetical protein AA0498_0235 [Acidomonas methanolica]|nr:hypothetical protein AA0498_0235 [Acidomonas methanolica]GEL00715.1 hypothetical protein AME01nite_32130 [Acidomonas methanolica NBRC 104435]
MVELLHAEGEHDIVDAERHHRASLLERRGCRGAGILDVDHRDTSKTALTKDDLTCDADLARDQRRPSSPGPGRFYAVDRHAGLGYRLIYGFKRKVSQPSVEMLAEPSDANTSNDCILFHLMSVRHSFANATRGTEGSVSE